MRKIEILVPDTSGKALTEIEDLIRFWMRVRFGGADECWLWTGAMFQEGYGQFISNGRSWPAHRIAYMDCIGPIPHGRKVQILCKTRACCNPAHLKLGGFGNTRNNLSASASLDDIQQRP